MGAAEALDRELNRLHQRISRLESQLQDLRNAQEVPEALPVSAFLRRFPQISRGSLSWELFNRTSNGLEDSGAVSGGGKGCRIYIDPRRYFEWKMTRGRKRRR